MYKKFLLGMVMTFVVINGPSYSMEAEQDNDNVLFIPKANVLTALASKDKMLEIKGKKLKLKTNNMAGKVGEMFLKDVGNLKGDVSLIFYNGIYRYLVRDTKFYRWNEKGELEIDNSMTGYVELEFEEMK